MNSITKLHVLFFFVFIFYAVSCTAKLEKQTYTNVYDLHFAMRFDSAVVYPWRENGAYSNYTINGERVRTGNSSIGLPSISMSNREKAI